MVNIALRTEARERLLKINERPIVLDDLAQRARLATGERFLQPVPLYTEESAKGDGDGVASRTSTAQLLAYVREKGLGATVLRLTALLNKTALEELPRTLLATPGVYESLLLKLVAVENNPTSDVETLRQSIVAELDDEPREFFTKQIVRLYVQKHHLDLDDTARNDLYQSVLGTSLPLADGRLAPAIERILDTIDKEGSLARLVLDFAKSSGIEPTRFTPAVRAGMVDYLETLGLESKGLDVVKHEAYFVQAYHYVLFNGGGGAVATIAPRIEPLDSDFDLDTFDLAPEQGVIVENVLAASALHYLSVLGDGLGMFALANSLILLKAKGLLDLSRGTAGTKLQAYKKYLKYVPVSTEERQLLAKRVFDYGDGETLEGTVINEEFPTLWNNLMKDVADYIRKTEENSSDLEDRISRGPIDESVRNLQYNLSYYAQDIAEDVLDIREQFNMVKGLLSDEFIMAAVGSTRRNDMWSMIERLSSRELHRSVNVKAYRTVAVEGYKVLQYVAHFDVATPEDKFGSFLRSAEAFIIAKAALGDEIEHTGPPSDDSDDGFGERGADRMDKEIDDWDA